MITIHTPIMISNEYKWIENVAIIISSVLYNDTQDNTTLHNTTILISKDEKKGKRYFEFLCKLF